MREMVSLNGSKCASLGLTDTLWGYINSTASDTPMGYAEMINDAGKVLLENAPGRMMVWRRSVMR